MHRVGGYSQPRPLDFSRRRGRGPESGFRANREVHSDPKEKNLTRFSILTGVFDFEPKLITSFEEKFKRRKRKKRERARKKGNLQKEKRKEIEKSEHEE